jgi:ketopantoate reductase
MRIAVIGTGGIGAPYGASLAKAGGAQVRYFWAPANLV